MKNAVNLDEVARVRQNPVIKKLLSLNLPPDDYAIFGSGPLFAHGITDRLGDLDVVARGKAWKKALKLGRAETPPSGASKLIKLYEGKIEIFSGWYGWDVNELIDTAEVIEGLRFVNLESTLKWKKQSGRPKDKKHVKLIEAYLTKTDGKLPVV